MNKKLILILFAAMFIGAFGTYQLFGHKVIRVEGTMAYKSNVELIDESEIIIKGKVKEVLPSKWSKVNPEISNNVQNIIQTDISINIDEVYKGIPYNDKNVIVRIDKGEIGRTKVVSEGYPDFRNGEEVILFLSKDDGDLANVSENYYVLTGMSQGKFSLKDKNESEKKFINVHDENAISLSTFKDEVSKELDNLKKNPKAKMSKEEIKAQNEKIFGN
jgi:hypothetical protein